MLGFFVTEREKSTQGRLIGEEGYVVSTDFFCLKDSFFSQSDGSAGNTFTFKNY